MTDEDRDMLLVRIDERLEFIKGALARDYKCLHGNGQPGLIERVQKLEDYHANENGFFKKYGGFVAWLIAIIIAGYSAIKHH